LGDLLEAEAGAVVAEAAAEAGDSDGDQQAVAEIEGVVGGKSDVPVA
jgi:hypothetical protein